MCVWMVSVCLDGECVCLDGECVTAASVMVYVFRHEDDNGNVIGGHRHGLAILLFF